MPVSARSSRNEATTSRVPDGGKGGTIQLGIGISLWLFPLLQCGVLPALQGSPSRSEPGKVVAAEVEIMVHAEQQSFLGSIEAIRRSTIGAEVEGRVRDVHFEKGGFVLGDDPSHPDQLGGQVLVEMDTSTIDLQIDAARIQLSLLENAHTELQLTLPIDLRLAETRLADARDKKNISESEFVRLQAIDSQSSAISRSELDQARNQYQSDLQATTLAEIELERLKSTREIIIQQSEQRIAAARQEITRLEESKSRHMIRAPFAGFVVDKLTESGAWLSTGAPVAEIVELDEVDFVFNIPQEFIGKLQQIMSTSNGGVMVELEIQGIDTPIPAVVRTLVPQVDLRTRMISVRARCKNPELGDLPLLKPGMLGRASLAIGEKREIVVLPRDALVIGGPQPLVFKVLEGPDGTFARSIVVNVGQNIGELTEVSGDITAGDLVVVLGNERLLSGSKVRVEKVIPSVKNATLAPSSGSSSEKESVSKTDSSP